MPGMLGFFGKYGKHIHTDLLIETINPLSLCDTKILNTEEGFLALSWLRNNSLLSCRYYENSNYVACFSGDLIDVQRVPWNLIINNFRTKRYKHFSDYRGTFAIAIFDKINKRVSIISDRTSQKPIYYFITNNGFTYSTAISTYCKLPDIPQFNVNWLHEFLFFNYPMGQTTFLKNVLRMPPAAILEYHLKTSKTLLFEYAKPFKKANNIIKGKKAVEKALSVFNERVPKYFQRDTQIAVSLSGGFDSRTVLSFAPSETKASLEAYTYGVAGCLDLLEASKIASMLKIPHTKIILDNRCLDILQELIYETVYLSDGLQGINRSTLPYVYKMLTNNGTKCPIIITGVSGDHLFRDHVRGTGNVPAIISSDMMQIFKEGTPFMSKSFFRRAYGANFGEFQQHIYDVLQDLTTKYGELNVPESYLSYLIYEVTPNYFAGQAAIADNYSTLRSPYWDADIIQLSYEIEYSTLGFSESLFKKDKYRECVLQAYLMQSNKTFSKVPFHDIPLRFFSINYKFLYNLYRTVRKGPNKVKSILKPTPHPPLEDWQNWYDTRITKEIGKLISKNSIISNYLTSEFIEEIKHEKDIHWLGKLVTVEIILRLINNRWNLLNPHSQT